MMRAKLRHLCATLAVLGLVAMGLSACNTTKGVGEDVSATGQAVTGAAKKVQQGL